MSSTTSPGSDRSTASDTNSGASANVARENYYGKDAERKPMSGSDSQGAAQDSGSDGHGLHAAGHEHVNDLAHQAQQLCHDSMESMKSYIAQHPVSSVGIAVAAGCVLSMMLKEQNPLRDHSRH